MTTWHNPSVIAAFLSAVAAVAAAVATWRSPIAAARMAEALRRQSESYGEARRIKLNVFGSIMQERAEIYNEEAVRALNLIDVAFSDSIPVREAWAELYNALNTNPIPPHVIDERLRKLLREMAADLGLSDKLRQDDFGRVYFPNAVMEERNVRQLERKAALARLTQSSSPAANAADGNNHILERWPPKPE